MLYKIQNTSKIINSYKKKKKKRNKINYLIILLDKKGEVVAIVTMCSPLSYLFHSIFHKKSHDVYASDEDFMRLYNVKRTPTPNPNKISDDCWTLGDYLKSQNIDMNQIFNRRK